MFQARVRRGLGAGWASLFGPYEGVVEALSFLSYFKKGKENERFFLSLGELGLGFQGMCVSETRIAV